MTELILDTDILSEILKGQSEAVLAHRLSYETRFRMLSFTSTSVMEITTGYRRRQALMQQVRAEALFGRNNEIVPESEDYRLAGQIIGDLLLKGRPIGFIDPMIAACAIRRGLGVASGNTRHFEYIREAGYQFHLENWRDELP